MLDRVRIASPCTADWEQMLGDDRVRFCSQCNLNVYNLSAMTRYEAEELIANREGRLCTRFYRRADGTVLTRDCPVGLRAVVRRISRVAGAALSAMMSVSFAAAQNPSSKMPAQPLVQITPLTQTGVAVTVIDPTGVAIANAIVRMVHRTTKQETQGRTDANGRYRFVRLVPGAYEVSIESPGFASYKRQVAVREGEVLNKEVTLEVGATMGVIVEVTEDIQLLPSKINLTPKLRRAK